MTQSIGYGFAGGALLFSALGTVLTKKISGNFDKKVISSAIGFSILIIACCTPVMDDAMAPFMPFYTRDEIVLLNKFLTFVVCILGVSYEKFVSALSFFEFM